MKAIVIECFGGPEKLTYKDVPIPEPQDHEVLIKVEYASINPVDWKIREGLLKSRLPHQFPLILGWDASGVITDVGAHVKQFKAGDKVFTYCRKPIVQNGTYAEFVTFDAAHVALMPQNISFAQAASIPLAALTAWQALFDFAHLKSRQTLLVQAGAGGVGSFGIQFGRFAKAEVWTTCSSSNLDYVKKLGAHYVIDYTKEDLFTRVRDKHPEGLDVVFDTLGGKALQNSFSLIKPHGNLVSIIEVPSNELIQKHQLKCGYLFVRPEGHQLSEIARLIEQGLVTPPEIKEYPLEKASEAHEDSQKGHTRGKIVLKIGT